MGRLHSVLPLPATISGAARPAATPAAPAAATAAAVAAAMPHPPAAACLPAWHSLRPSLPLILHHSAFSNGNPANCSSPTTSARKARSFWPLHPSHPPSLCLLQWEPSKLLLPHNVSQKGAQLLAVPPRGVSPQHQRAHSARCERECVGGVGGVFGLFEFARGVMCARARGVWCACMGGEAAGSDSRPCIQRPPLSFPANSPSQPAPLRPYHASSPANSTSSPRCSSSSWREDQRYLVHKQTNRWGRMVSRWGAWRAGGGAW